MRSIPPLKFPSDACDVLRLQLRQHAVDEVGVDVVARGAAARAHAPRRAATSTR